ncbi:MAG: hypothetical protein WDW38_004853 [Sanguina aurantia]
MVLPYLQALRRAGCAPKAKGHGSVVTVKTLSNPAYAQSTLQSGHAAAEPLRAGPCTSLGFRSSSQLTALVAAPAYSPLGFLDGDSDTRAPTSPPLRKGELPSRDSSRSSCSPGSSKESTGAAITAETLQDACSIFGSFLEEHEYWVEEQHVDGTIPAELLGTFFRNGPGLQVDRPGHQRHTFDGDGMLLSMAFKDGKAFFRNRYVRTRGFVDEQEAGKPLYRNTFSKGSADGGRWFNPLDLKFKNVANTGVIFWAGRLLALWEAGRPHLLDATTLHTTERESNLGGCIGNVLAGHYRVTTEYSQSSPSQLADDSSSSGSSRSSSSTNNSSFREKSKTVSSRHSYNTGSDTTTDHHSSGGSSSNRRGASSGDLNSRGSRGRHVSSLTPTTPGSSSSKRWVTFGTGASLTGCNITFYEFLEDGTRIHATTHPLHGVDLSFVHDMAVTEHYYIVLLGPLHFNVGTFVTRYAIGNCTIADCLEYNEEGNTCFEARAVPVPGGPAKARILQTKPFYSFHHVNAFETHGGGRVVLDTIAWDHVDLNVNQYTVGEDHYSGGCRSELHRLVCDLSGGGSVSVERVMRRTVEFPGINPLWNGLPHQHSYLVADTVDHELLWGPGQAHSIPTPSSSTSSSSSSQHIMTSTDSTLNPCCSIPGNSTAQTAVTTQMWVAGPRHFPGEPTFIPRPGSTREDDGWLLSVLHDAGEDLAQVLIFDALDISVGPVATIRLQHRLPAGFHGYFSHEFLGPDPASAEHHVRQPPNLIRQL